MTSSPVADGQASRLGQLGPRSGAGADQDQVALDGAAFVDHDRLDPAVAAEGGDPGAEGEPDAVVGVQVAVDASDLGAEHPSQRDGVRADQGDVPAELAQGGGGLAADPAGPHHHNVLGPSRGGGEHVAVLAGAQVVDAGQVRPGQWQAARGGAGGQQEPLVADALARGQLQLVAGRGDRADRGRGAQLDLVVGVEPVLVHIQAVAVGLAAQVRLGQRRPLIGLFGFVAEQQQAAVEAVGAQGLGCSGAGQTGTDDHKG